MTNRTAVKKIIQMAEAHNDLADLVYYVWMRLPLELRPRPDATELAATFPPGWIPVIPLTPDPKVAEQWAYLLLEIIKAGNEGRGILFQTGLSSRLYLQELGLAFYEWGDWPDALVDWICPTCGAVEKVLVGEVGTCCTRRRERRVPAKQCYPLPANAQRVGLNWWGGGEANADDLWCEVRHVSPFVLEVGK